MKEQLQSKLVEVLTGLQTAVGKASDFAIDQLPDVAMQYIKFATVMHGAIFSIFAIATVLLVAVAIKAKNNFDDICVGFAFASVITLIISCYNLYYLLLVTIAPKVFLIQEISRMIK